MKENQVSLPEKSPELAEFIGIMLGDGCIPESKGKYEYNGVEVIGHLYDDEDYLLNYVIPLTKKLFGITFNFYKYHNDTSLRLKKGSKQFIKILLELGLKRGNKLKNNVSIPDWIFESEEYIKSCVKGLIDTDGYVCPITGRDYSYVWFNTSIPNLRDSFKKAMDILGLRIAKWYKRERVTKMGKGISYQTYIGAKSHISKYYKEI